MKRNVGTYVLITTEFRGVFVGRVEEDLSPDQMTLTECRNVIYWGGTEGFLGLAAHGPAKDSRLGAIAPRETFFKITSVGDCTEAAAEKFRSGIL